MNRLRLGATVAAAALIVIAAGVLNEHRAARVPPEPPQSSIAARAVVPFPDPASRPYDPKLARSLQSVLDGVVAEYRRLKRGGFPQTPVAAPGITAAVVSEAGTWAGAAGTGGDGSALAPTAMMAIGSITKTFTAAEVVHLADEGKIDLQAPLSRYLGPTAVQPRATVRQALAMTSGLPFDDDAQPALTAGALVDGCVRHWTPEQAVRALVSAPIAPPGGAPVYSNAGFVLLGRLIEQVTGKPLATALRSDILEPAGLTRVAVQDAETVTAPVALPPSRLKLGGLTGYLPCRSLASAAFSAGGMASDAPTVARWGYELYGSRLVPADTVADLITQQSPTDIDIGVGYGLGTMIFHNLQYTIDDSVGHTGEILGYTSLLAVSERDHVSVALLIDEDGKDTTSIMRRLFAALRACGACLNGTAAAP